MKKIITAEQKKEVVKLANDGHYEALIAYGADMYRKGIVKGGLIAVSGIFAIGTLSGLIKHTNK